MSGHVTVTTPIAIDWNRELLDRFKAKYAESADGVVIFAFEQVEIEYPKEYAQHLIETIEAGLKEKKG